MDPMIGMIFVLPFNWAPVDYSFCQGQTLQVQQYAALFSLIGARYGGNGVSDFKLPDLRGRVPLGVGVNSTIPPGEFQLASTGGAATETLTQAQMPIHNHTAAFTAQTGQQSVKIPAVENTLNVAVDIDAYGAAGDSNVPTSSTNMLAGVANTGTKLFSSPKTANLVKLANVNTAVTGKAGSPETTLHINSVTGGSVAVGNAGGSQPISLMQPYLALNFVIALNGIYPSRP